MEQVISEIPLNYVTVKVTKSRIDKGLLAIPVSLIDIFPQQKGCIFIEGHEGVYEKKTYTPYTSTSRECRIGGLNDFYKRYEIRNKDEIVIQKIDDMRYRIVPEKEFKENILDVLSKFENSIDEIEANKYLKEASLLSNLDKNTVLCNEFIGLSKKEILPRKSEHKILSTSKESVPLSMRKILLSIYKGECQISGFTFLMKNGNPYFELHHINPLGGNHPKNLLVVCPNVHAQFTYANIEQSFDSDGWLRAVRFNAENFTVFQIIDTLQLEFKKEIHFT
ncbi:MAG: HNH endonuclease [Treponema sp.]|jgi:hypothetical protein|nr:HNH endonuclease [Treponema sp.]